MNFRRSHRSMVSLFCVAGFTLVGLAQPPAYPPVTPNPHAPAINAPFPLGMQRGTTLDLTLAGTNLAEPTGVLASFPATITIPPENNNGKDNAKLLIRLQVPANALMGWHTIRVATTRGVSNFRLFCIDDLPQVLEQDTNRSQATAQVIPLPCVVCGRADPEITDYYKITVKAGERVSFEVLGRRLGSALDPMIRIVDPRNGRQIAFSDDAPGQGKDPRLSYAFKEAGDYIIELRDVRYQGGGDWFYRLRVGDFPCATTPVPLAVQRGTATKISFAGPNVDSVARVLAVASQQLQAETLPLVPARAGGGLPGWPVYLGISDLSEALETEPNDESAKANRIALPGAVSGRLQAKGDHDFFVFNAKKGQRIILECNNPAFHSPTMVYMVLKDAKGAQVGASDPKIDPAKIDFTAAADGDYTLDVEHLHYSGGPEDTYRITVLPYEQEFSLSAGIDRFDVPQGSSAIIQVQVTRQGYTGPIAVSVAGPAGITGATTIAAGKTVALMNLDAVADASVGAYPLQLVGRAVINKKTVIEQADVRPLVVQNLANLPFPPRHLAKELVAAVTEKPPFSIQAKIDLPEAVRGVAAPITVTAVKAAGFDEEITVTAVATPVPAGQPAPIAPATVKIPKGQTTASLKVTAAAQVPLGAFVIGFTGKGVQANKPFTVATPLTTLTLALPFDLQVDAAGGKITAEGKHKIKVKAVRKGGYTGPINLEVKNLPANVTAAAATIAANQNEIEIELTAAGNAAVGDKADVNVAGTATGAANQAKTSPNFTLSVVKK